MLELGKKFAFEIYGAKKLCLVVFENNPAALHCYKAVGFKETGIAEKYKLKDEEWTCIEMEMNRAKKKYRNRTPYSARIHNGRFCGSLRDYERR